MLISKRVLIIIFALYLFGLFFHLGRMYFQHEEPRRAIIALEMNYSGNYVQPTVLGKAYFKKPPLHNIVIAMFFKIFKENEFAARLVSVLSLLAFAGVIFLVLKDIVGIEASVFASFSFLTSFVTYFSYGILAETDMFFSFLVFCSMISLIAFKRYGILIGSLFAALALLTKGFPALHYFYFTLLAYGLLERKIKDSKFIIHSVIGSFIIFGLFGLWIFSFSHGNIHKIDYALGFLLSESGSRVLSIEHIFKALVHAVTFPIKFWYHFLPFSVLVFAFFNKHFRDEFFILLKSNKKIERLLKFSLFAFLPNFMVYDLIPDGRVRYTLVLFGFFAFLIGVLYYELEYVKLDFNTKRWSVIAFMVVAVVSFVSSVFVYEFTATKDYIVCILTGFVSLLFVYALKKEVHRQNLIFISFTGFAVLVKILYISTYFSYLFTYYTNYRSYGNRIARIILKNNPEYVMSDARDLRLFFYVERDLKMPIHTIKSERKGIVVSKHGNRVGVVKEEVNTPKGIYYIGIKNGGA